MKASREIFLVSGLLLLLVLITAAAGFFQSREEQVPPLSSNSNAPDGARALRLWLKDLGYPVSNQTLETFAIPPQTQAVFILEPTLLDNVTAEDWKSIEDWVSGGGVLFMASQNIAYPLNGSRLKIDTAQAQKKPDTYAPPAPFFRFPALNQPVKMSGSTVLKTNQANLLPLLSSNQGAAAVEVLLGQGKMILVTDTEFLTNSGLKDPVSAALALNLFAALPPGGAIWMDEWHHGQRAAGNAGAGPEAWLRNTSSGRALLFSAAVIFLALLLAGRRFGRPVPLPHDQLRRAPIEHVTALANLNRRAGHRRALMQSYHAGLKRAYGRRYRLDPGLPDEQYIARLASYNPDLDTVALLHLLKRLDRRDFTDAQMVPLAREAAQWMKHVEHENSFSVRR